MRLINSSDRKFPREGNETSELYEREKNKRKVKDEGEEEGRRQGEARSPVLGAVPATYQRKSGEKKLGDV